MSSMLHYAIKTMASMKQIEILINSIKIDQIKVGYLSKSGGEWSFHREGDLVPNGCYGLGVIYDKDTKRTVRYYHIMNNVCIIDVDKSIRKKKQPWDMNLLAWHDGKKDSKTHTEKL